MSMLDGSLSHSDRVLLDNFLVFGESITAMPSLYNEMRVRQQQATFAAKQQKLAKIEGIPFSEAKIEAT
jgi:hypothetical protein